jgi:hypothetical protein
MIGQVRLVILILLAACAARPQERISPPAPGALATIEAAHDLDGQAIGASPAHATMVIVLASWCEHCKDELAVIESMRAKHPALRIVGVSYKAHEEYDHRGNPAALRAYASAHAWLRIALADDAVFQALGAPPVIPALYVFDASGKLAAEYDRRQRAMPDATELGSLLAQLGA